MNKTVQRAFHLTSQYAALSSSHHVPLCPLVGAGCRLEPNPATPAREAAYTVDKSPADRRTATVYVIFCHESNMKEPVGEELREAGKSVKSRSIEEGGGGSLTLRNSVM